MKSIFFTLYLFWNYIFVPDLIVQPTSEKSDWPSKKLYKWQEMPHGWRWF